MGVPEGVWEIRHFDPPQTIDKKLHMQLSNFAQKLHFDVLWFRR